MGWYFHWYTTRKGQTVNKMAAKNTRTAPAWHETTPGLFVATVLEFGFAYIFTLWALDTGSTLDYLFTILFTVGFCVHFARLIGRFIKLISKKIGHGNKAATA